MSELQQRVHDMVIICKPIKSFSIMHVSLKNLSVLKITSVQKAKATSLITDLSKRSLKFWRCWTFVMAVPE